MNNRLFYLLCASCILAPAASVLSPDTAFAYGEDEDISSYVRSMHIIVNEARSDTRTALDGCGANCTEGIDSYDKVLPPLYWHSELHNAAQFHANMLSYLGGMCLQHPSPCKLKSDVGSTYPDQCDGNPSCACKDGKAKCGDEGTGTFDRVALFHKGSSSRAENIAWNGNGPYKTFFAFLHENGKTTYGHRKSLLSKSYKIIGIGNNQQWTVQDFGDKIEDSSPISSGFYYTDNSKNFWFKLHYYSKTTNAEKAAVSINGTCTELPKTLGSETNGVWGTNSITAPAKCTPFVFEVLDKDGVITTYPTTGSFLYECEKSWSSQTIATCLKTETGDEPGENTGDEPGENLGDEPGENTGDEPGENTGDEPGENTGDEPGENTGDEPGENSGDEPGENTGDEPGENTGDDSKNDDESDSSQAESSCSATPLNTTTGIGSVMLMFVFCLLLRRRKSQRLNE